MSPTATETSPVTPVVMFREILVDQLFPSPLNPRKTLDQAALADLAESIREKGIIEPLVVRWVSGDDQDTYEIVAGERRYRAAKLAGLTTAPCVVRELTDIEVVEHALTENHQRADVHPLEEADAIQQLLDLDRAYTVQGVAAKLGVSVSWVYGRLKLLQMSDAAQEAYRGGAITAEHADILARVPAHQQAAALAACFSQMLYEVPYEEVGEEETDTPYTIAQAIQAGRWGLLQPCIDSAASLRRWVKNHSTADIQDQAIQADIPELAVAIADAAAEDAALLQVSLDERLNESEAKALGVIRRARWIEIDQAGTYEAGRVSNERCEAMRQAVVTHPVTPGVLRVVMVCIKRTCPVHRPAPATKRSLSSAEDPRQSAAQRQAEEKRQREEAARAEQARMWKEEQRPKYLADLAARVLKTKAITPQMVKGLVEAWHREQVEKLYGVTLTSKNALGVFILASGPLGDWNMQPGNSDLVEFGALFGLPPAVWLRQHLKAQPKRPKAAENKSISRTPAAKPAKKKGGR